MATDWFLVKYVSDVFRDEARNVGVIVYGDQGAAAQFLGETDAGSFDGRRAKGAVASPDALREWIGYLRHHLEAGSLDHALESLHRRPFDNYRVERRGALLSGPANAEQCDAIVRELFTELVTTGASSPPELKEVVNDLLFRRISVPVGHEIERDVQYSVTLRGETVMMPFDYRYVNGVTTLLERVSLSGGESASSRKVNDLLFRIENVESQGVDRFLAIYDIGRSRMTSGVEKQLSILQKYAFTVPARSSDAAKQISESLGVLSRS